MTRTMTSLLILAASLALMARADAAWPSAPAAAPAPVCLASDAAVRAAYGDGTWATWRRIGGRRCWMPGARHGRRIAAQRHHRRDAAPAIVTALPAAPPPPAAAGPAPAAITPAAVDFAQAKEILRRAMTTTTGERAR